MRNPLSGSRPWWAGVLALVCAVMIAPGLVSAQATQDVERLEQEARALFDQERYEEAVQVLQSILSTNPGNRTANILLSFAFARLERAGQAIEQTRRAFQLFPANVKLQLLLAGLLTQQDVTRTEGIQLSQAVLRRQPDNMLALLGLAEAFRVQGQVFDAIHGFTRLAEGRPEDARYVVRLGQLYATLGDLKESRRHFERAYGRAPENIDTLRSLAILGDVEDRPQEAVRYYRELLRLLPTDVSVQLAVRAAEERLDEPQFPVPLDEMEKTPLEKYVSAIPRQSKQLQQRREQLEALRWRSYTRFLPSFYVNPSRSTTRRGFLEPGVTTRDDTESLSFSIGWNLGDILSNPYRAGIVGLEADFQTALANLTADVTATYYQRLQNILEYRRLQRALALSPLNAQLRQSKQAMKYAILNLAERLKIITDMP